MSDSVRPYGLQPAGSSVHGILQARVLEWVVTSSSRRSSQPRDQTCVSCLSTLAGKFFTTSTIWETPSRGSVQFSSVAQSCLTLCDPMNCSTPGLPVHRQLPEFTQLMSTESVMPSSHLILCCPLLLLPPIPPSIRVFSNESTLHMRWPKYWSSASASFLPKKSQG